MRISDWSSDVCSSDLFRRKFEVRPLDDGIDRARFLTEAAIDALGHVDVVARRAAAAVLARLGLDCDGERRAHRLAQFARDTALLAIRITAQRMLAAETGRDRVLLVRVVDRRLGPEEIFQGQPMRFHELPESEGFDPVRDHEAPPAASRPWIVVSVRAEQDGM